MPYLIQMNGLRRKERCHKMPKLVITTYSKSSLENIQHMRDIIVIRYLWKQTF